MRWIRRGGRRELVIGQEMADAVAAESLHATTGPSPLEGVSYDDSGDIALCRFVPVAVDDTVASFASEFAASDEHRRNEMRAALTMPDLYTLLNFARRAGGHHAAPTTRSLCH